MQRDTQLSHERQSLVLAALPHVPFSGWSDKTLQDAVRDCGYDPVMAYRCFPGGVPDLVDAFIEESDRRMLERFAELSAENLRIRERIATAIRVRLEWHQEHKEAVRHTVAFYSIPLNTGRGVKRIAHTCDAIWRACGDTATDWNFYSKRMLLAGVYTSTLSFWLNDSSEGMVDTWAFLDRRIGNVMEIQKFKGKYASKVQALGEAVKRGPRFPFHSV